MGAKKETSKRGKNKSPKREMPNTIAMMPQQRCVQKIHEKPDQEVTVTICAEVEKVGTGGKRETKKQKGGTKYSDARGWMVN